MGALGQGLRWIECLVESFAFATLRGLALRTQTNVDMCSTRVSVCASQIRTPLTKMPSRHL